MAEPRVMTFSVENLLERFVFRKFEITQLATLLDIEAEADREHLVRTYWNILNTEPLQDRFNHYL